MKLLLNWILSAITLLIVAQVAVGFEIVGFWSALVAAAVLGLANVLIRPFVLFLTLPINFVTLGLFTFVVNGLMLWLMSTIVKGVTLESFGAAVWAAIILFAFNMVINWVFTKLNNSVAPTVVSQE